MTNGQVGDFFILGWDGMEVTPSLTRLVERYGLGGVILFDRNIDSPAQIKKLTQQIRQLPSKHPLLISTDQEGGQFQRMKPPRFGTLPPACDVRLDDALEVGRKLGRELSELGLNLDMAPVLDVHTNPQNPIIGVRSFHSDPATVVAVGQKVIQGMHEHEVWACEKHFPGHGDTSEDSHLTLPVVNHPLERLQEIEIRPFRELFAHELQFVMSAHVVYPALDPEKRPATFSPPILQKLLRDDLGFEGLVVTDDLGMAGSLSRGDIVDAVLEAFAAGCDLLLVCEHLDRHEEVIAKLGEAITQSTALQERAKASRARLASLNLN